MRLTVIGTGCVGLNTGVASAYLGHDVVCANKDSVKVTMLNKGKSLIHEQGYDELLAEVAAACASVEGRGSRMVDLGHIVVSRVGC